MNKMFLLTAAVAVLISAPDSYAQEKSGAMVLEEVIVTAQRREESLMEVPISITAFSAADIEKGNITEAKDYLALSPNVSFTESGEKGNRSIQISVRGISNIDLGESGAINAIGYYIDELNVGSTANGTINPQLYDMASIEVLRGPQGTYFGRNAMGGALNIQTNKPDENFYGEIGANLSRFNTWGVNGVVNAPLADNVFIRIVGAYENSDGVVKNVNPLGSPDSGYKNKHLRFAIRALPTDTLTLDFSATYTDEDEGFDAEVGSGVLDLDTQSIFGSGFTPIDDQLGFYPQNQRYVNHDAKEYNRNKFVILNGRVTYQGNGFSVHSITGYLKSDNGRFFDQDNISVDAIVRENDYEGKSFSQELRLQSDNDGPLSWTIGGIYSKDKIDQFNSIRAGSQGYYVDPVTGEVIGLLPPIPAGFRINENYVYSEVESYAFFADATYAATDQFFITLGGRYTHDKNSLSLVDVVAFEGAVPDLSGDSSFHDFSPRLVFRYLINDQVSTYASVSKGYKAGGINLNGNFVDPVRPFDPEKLWNYELGLKASAADGRVNFRAAVFYVDWKDVQSQSNFLADPNDISSATTLTLNASSATNKGAEFDIQALLSDNLQVSFGAGYLKSKFGKFPDAILAGANVVDLTGLRLPKTPEWTLNGTAEYTHALTDTFNGFIRTEWVYHSKSFSDLEAVASEQLNLPKFPYSVPDFNVVNLRLGIENDNLTLTGYVENLFGEDYYTATQDNFGLGGMRLRPHPRIWGVKVMYRFF